MPALVVGYRERLLAFILDISISSNNHNTTNTRIYEVLRRNQDQNKDQDLYIFMKLREICS
jgi:hypothetical protein